MSEQISTKDIAAHFWDRAVRYWEERNQRGDGPYIVPGSHALHVKPDGETPGRLLPEALFQLTACEIDRAFIGREQLDLPVRNDFLPGLFVRELFIPAGTLLTGRKHRFPH